MALPKYHSGEVVCGGDQVRWAGHRARVVFVLGAAGCPAAFAADYEWYLKEHGGGFLLEVERIGFVFEHEADEDLEFVCRGEYGA